MRSLFLAFTVLIFGCGSKTLISTSKENEYRTYFSSRLKDYDSTASIDSFCFIRYDTLTQFSKLIGQYNNALGDLELNSKLLDLENKKMNLTGQELLLYRNLDNNLFEQEKMEAKNEIDSGRAIEEKVFQLKRRVNFYDSLLKKADTVKTIGYTAVCFYQVRNRDQSVKKDTFRVILNTDMNIITPKDFYKE